MVYVIKNHTCLGTGTNSSCTFDHVNGGFLTGMSLLGLILNVVELIFLRYFVYMNSLQKIFIANVSVCDFLMAIVGLFRGLGIVTPLFLKPGSQTEVNSFCAIYAIMLNVVTSECMLVLLPLTIDRFLAIALPLRHRYLITKTRTVILVGAMWIFPVMVLFYDVITYYMTGHKKMNYNTKYHRCVSDDELESNIVFIVGVMIPLILIPVLYLVMLFFIHRNGVKCKRFFLTCSGIIISSMIAFLPAGLSSLFDIPMNYVYSMILTVTVYYSNSLINPIIYFCLHPRTKEALKGIKDKERGFMSNNHSDVAHSTYQTSFRRPHRSPRFATPDPGTPLPEQEEAAVNRAVSFNMKKMHLLEKKPTLLTVCMVNKAFDRNKKKSLSPVNSKC